MQNHIDHIRQCLKIMHPMTAVELAGAAAIEKDLREMEKESARRIVNLAEENADLRALVKKHEKRLFAFGAMEKPPCFRCGYNGPGYYQPDKHPCAALHHKARAYAATEEE